MVFLKHKCKKCRSLGMKLLLNERCSSQKCALVRRRTRPGLFGNRPRILSAYGKQLLEKQKLKYTYLLKDKQLKNYFEKASQAKNMTTAEALIQLLERRLDNVIWRAGYVPARTTARQLVSHGHFLVNGRRVFVPSYLVDVGDVISLRPKSLSSSVFANLEQRLLNSQPPNWLEVNPKTFETKVIKLPTKEDAKILVDLNLVVDFYNR